MFCFRLWKNTSLRTPSTSLCLWIQHCKRQIHSQRHSHHSVFLLYKHLDFHRGPGLAESLNLYSARQRTNGGIFKDKGRQYQTPWICLGLNSHWCFSKASPTAGLFSMAQDGTAYKFCLGEFQIRERIVIIIIEYSQSMYLTERKWSIHHQRF